MMPDQLAVLTILSMALVTYATRVGGLWLLSRLPTGGRVALWLRQVPGAILIAIIAPNVATGGLPTLLAAAATLLAMAWSRSLLLAMVVGVAAIWLLR